MGWGDLLGKKAVAFRGYRIEKYGATHNELSVILFDDEETYMQFTEQDPYDYHDYCSAARIIYVYKDAKKWRKMFEKDGFTEIEASEIDF